MKNTNLSSSNGKVRLAAVYRTFGNQTLLLHWPWGSKGTKSRWGKLNLADTQTPSYQRKLASGNIGIALGPRSGGLCAIDLDCDDLRDRFLEENTWAKNTTEVRGARGSKFFVRVVGNYPSTHHFFRDKKNVGQWLANGSQAIVSGQHPEGMWYCFRNSASPQALRYEDIKWPSELKTGKQTHFTEQQSSRATEAAEQPSSTEHLEAVICGVVAQFIPTTIHQNNPLMFQIGRGLRDVEYEIGKELTIAERKIAFDKWAPLARRYWRPDQTEDEYWFEFLDACERAQYGLQADPREGAWEESAIVEPPLESCRWVTDTRIKRLISLCIVLKRRRHGKPFFAPTRWIAGLFNISHTQAAQWVRVLCHLKILRLVTAGTKTRCPRYECLY